MIQQENNTWIKTTCPYCGVGCGIEAKVGIGNQVLLRGDRDHPANAGKLCSKGMALTDTLVTDGRLLHPMVGGQRVSWNYALDRVAEGFSEVISRNGPDAVAFYVSGQLLTEDYYVANKLMKGFIGSANIDTNSRLCMSSSVEGHKRAFGSDTVPGCYEDLELAHLVVLVGSNLAWCHPVLYQRLKAAKERDPKMKVVVVDPRMTATSSIADIHIALDPGKDVALFNGLLAYLEVNDGIDRDYISRYVEGGMDASRSAVSEFSGCLNLRTLAVEIGVEENQLAHFYRLFLETEKVVTVYSQGVNQSIHGVDKVNSIINCHLATGRIGKSGMGPLSVTGQPNAMGGREVGGMATSLAAHMEIANPEHRALLSSFWNSDRIPDSAGLTAVELFDGVARGDIKAVWIMGTNPAVSMPDADKVLSALQDCPLVVVSDCIQTTDTSRCADILLPAAGWSEKSGSVTNSERRISRQRRFLDAAGEAQPDWWIICEVAKRLGYEEDFPFSDEYEIFLEHARLSSFGNSGQRSFDLGGLANLSREEYERLIPQQWPILAGERVNMPATETGHKRLFSDGRFFTQSSKAQMVPVRNRSAADAIDTEYPLTLNTGRIRDQWHTMTRTALSHLLSAQESEPFLYVHSVDARVYQLESGRLVRVESRWGAAVLRAVINNKQKPGQLFMPIHWTGNTSSEGKAGPLVGGFTDEISRQPEFKMTPVRLEPLSFKSEALVIARKNLAFTECDYWVRQKVPGGYAYHLASDKNPSCLAAMLNRKLMTGDQQVYSFEDAGADHYRFIGTNNGRIFAALIVCSQIDFEQWEWAKSVLDDVKGINGIDAIVRGKADDAMAGGKLLCACKQVGNSTIRDAIIEEGLLTVADICDATQAGTGCGSCLPELEMLLTGEYAAS